MGRGGRRSIKGVTLGGSNNTESAPNPHALPPPRHLWLAPAAQLAETFDWPCLNNAGGAGRGRRHAAGKDSRAPVFEHQLLCRARLAAATQKQAACPPAGIAQRHAAPRASARTARHAQGRPAAASRLRGSSCGTSAFGAKRFSEWSWFFHPASFHFLRHIMWPGVEEARNGRRHRRPRPSKGRRSGKTSEQNRTAFGARGKSYKRAAPPLTQTKPVGAADTAQKHTPKLPDSPRMIARAHAAAFSPSHPKPIFTHQLSFRRGRPRRHRRRPLAPTLRAWRAAALAAALR